MLKKGFTLVEIIVAAVILTIVVSGMFMVFKSGERFSTEDKHKTQAQNLSRKALEEIKKESSEDFNGDKLKPGAGKEVTKKLGIEDTLDEKVDSSSFTYEVEPITEGGKTVAKKVTVKYNWEFFEGGGEKGEEVALSTVVANPDAPPSAASEAQIK